MCRRYLPGNQDPPVGLEKLNNAKAVTATKNKAQKQETFMMSLILLLTKPQEDNIIYQDRLLYHSTASICSSFQSTYDIYNSLKQRNKGRTNMRVVVTPGIKLKWRRRMYPLMFFIHMTIIISCEQRDRDKKIR